MTDASFVASIIEQLNKGGPLRDPRPPSNDPQTDQNPLAAYVASEVQRSVNRVRMLRTFKPRGKMLEMIEASPTIADYRKAARLLRQASAALCKVALFDEQRLAIPEMERISQELDRVWRAPPAHANALKYLCSNEAFDLMTFFSAKPPTNTKGGRFRTIAALLYQAVTGRPCDPDAMERSTDLVLRDRKRGSSNPNARGRLVAK